jgi:hypothetical protein
VENSVSQKPKAESLKQIQIQAAPFTPMKSGGKQKARHKVSLEFRIKRTKN